MTKITGYGRPISSIRPDHVALSAPSRQCYVGYLGLGCLQRANSTQIPDTICDNWLSDRDTKLTSETTRPRHDDMEPAQRVVDRRCLAALQTW
jgi:hypothetical protein